ncbi:MAG: glycosyltransferase family 2 protein [Phycisphaerae bacterium]|jgi:cellulose synthase/poly-beta-1,6-N-acetylglucosamine synthase-like glycosyltransferase
MTAALILAILSGISALIWSTRHILIWREQRNNELLTPDSAGVNGSVPHVSVFVAAKDEEENIETCVRTMLAQDYPHFDMTVCNDRSADRTGQIVAGVAREDPRLRLLNIEHLPAGWCGKCHAMWNGIAQSDSEWICMSDADCRQLSPRTLSVAVRYAIDNKIDLLSLMPALDMQGFWENTIQPVCSGVMMIWYQPEKVNNPAKSNAYANGAFILMRRSAYQAVGNHEAVKDKLMEDMHLAARVKKAGLKLRVMRSSGLYSVRMYTSLQQILRGWSRIFFGTFGTLPRLTVSLIVLLVISMLPYAAAPIGLTMAAADGPHAGAWLVAGLLGTLSALMQLTVIYRFYKIAGAKASLFWTYPFACVIVTWTLLLALNKHRPGAKVVWRNTAYAKSQ